MITRKVQILLLFFLGAVLIGLSGWLVYNSLRSSNRFDGRRAYKDVLSQVSFGARTPGSFSHAQAITYIQQELEKAGWEVQIQATEWQGFSIQNIIASHSLVAPNILFGAHYDSRLLADQDTGTGGREPVPGANDGASGVAVLLELARTLPSDGVSVWLVFFDAEDNGGLDNRSWIMGSRAFVAGLTEKPQAAVIVDMVGDENLNLYFERNSDIKLTAEIWTQAAMLGYSNNFIATPKYDMIDDHIPFLEAGIPAVDIIDFDYPYWHTSTDTTDKVSAQSLQVVGETLEAWIESLR
jgi:Iap family predicted aminopeptidase